ncbi:unnamed protein product [Eruca vesicaria subsp. sativa]|uniref:Longin domain-containing protein n=1 Tax=Eruca vesicaria subsp. sativa TaxID=29727 RepID=A0ABC8JS21_ERUVS|nr:unnamed protein product [Eruca vesicaria subsp. sativa]
MGQESFIYSFVARGTMVLAEFTCNFPSIAAQCLQKLPSSSNSKFTSYCDHHTFNFLVEDGFGMALMFELVVTPVAPLSQQVMADSRIPYAII